jgi:hypothetical protein
MSRNECNDGVIREGGFGVESQWEWRALGTKSLGNEEVSVTNDVHRCRVLVEKGTNKVV